jgi:DNA-binding XRE family transcriptional regulator
MPLFERPLLSTLSLMPKRKEEAERDPVLVAVGRTIRSVRESRKVSQEKFALKAGLDRTYYAGVELGYRNVSAKNLVKIALHLGVEVGDLFPKMEELAVANAGGTDAGSPEE